MAHSGRALIFHTDGKDVETLTSPGTRNSKHSSCTGSGSYHLDFYSYQMLYIKMEWLKLKCRTPYTEYRIRASCTKCSVRST